LAAAYRTADDRWLMLTMLQPGRYWPEFCRAVGREELVTDERFDSAEKIMANALEASDIVADIIAGRTKDDWVQAFTGMEGQWSVVQNDWEVGNDPTLRALGQICEVTDAEGVPRRLVASPVQFDRTPPQLTRAPLFAEHTDDILRELGRSDEEIIDLKIAGAVS
jgi:crotonobetainyl-CoA:carnitine CoA-transferase CaiB-like acyl-CoA transferase